MEEERVEEQIPEVEPAKVERQPLSPPAKMAIAGAVVLILVLVQAWMGSRRVEGMRREMLAQSADGLSEACRYVILDSREQRRASELAARIGQAAGYDRVVFADREGKVVGSTNSADLGRTVTDLRDAPLKARVRVVDGRLRATRAIVLGSNNVIGAIQVDVAD